MTIAADRLHLLNPSAALLWEGRKVGLDETALADRLTASYGLTPATARAAVNQTLANWQRTGLLDAAHSPVAPFPLSPPPAIHDPPPSWAAPKVLTGSDGYPMLGPTGGNPMADK